MLRLRVGDSGETKTFDQPSVTIGRNTANRLVVPDTHVSGFHAEIEHRVDGYFVCDAGSANGTRLRRDGAEQPVGSKANPTRLKTGDQILVGDPANSAVLHVSIDESVSVSVTVVARKDMNLASREMVAAKTPAAASGGVEWTSLFALFQEIAGAEPEVAERRVLQFILEAAPAVSQVSLFLRSAEGTHWRLSRDEARAGAEKSPLDTLPRALTTAASANTDAVLFSEAPSMSVDARGIRTAILAPLRFRGETTGFLLASGPTRGALTAADLEKVAVVAHEVSSQVAMAELLAKLRAAEARLREENRYLRDRDEKARGPVPLGSCAALKKIMDEVRQVAPTDTTVLILGETGTGKELIARAVHAQSRRRDGLFAAVNCGALTETLLESELFGHVRGAFTGAHKDKKGLFEVADGGTLFLDELGEMPASLQVKLLRVLQGGEFLPVGSERPKKTSVRIVAATNRDLKAMVDKETFRQDLYYRLSVFLIDLPPLRERGEDVVLLAKYFVDVYAKKLGKVIAGLSADAAGALLAYPFPGNVRELENEMERAVLLAEPGASIDRAVLSDKVVGSIREKAAEGVAVHGKLKEVMARLEAAVLRRALEEHGWNRSRSARTLGISRQALLVKLQRYKLVGAAADEPDAPAAAPEEEPAEDVDVE